MLNVFIIIVLNLNFVKLCDYPVDVELKYNVEFIDASSFNPLHTEQRLLEVDNCCYFFSDEKEGVLELKDFIDFFNIYDINEIESFRVLFIEGFDPYGIIKNHKIIYTENLEFNSDFKNKVISTMVIDNIILKNGDILIGKIMINGN